MSTLTLEQRANLAEAMLPVAAELAVLVHGDGGPEDVADLLGRLDDTQRRALLVVLAGLVDPDRPLTQLLGWAPDLIGPTAGPDEETLRDVAEDHARGYHCVTCSCATTEDEHVDAAVVDAYLAGLRPQVNRAERLAAILEWQRRGLILRDMDDLNDLAPGTSDRFLRRANKEAASGVVRTPIRKLTDEQVIEMRTRSAAGGETDAALAIAYGVSGNSVGRILRGEHYANVGGPIRGKRAVALTTIPRTTNEMEKAA